MPTDTASNPITLGVTEPFTQTISVAFYAALLLALPLILYQLYAFLIPAFTPGERKIALPIMLLVPFLFLAGLAFGYFVVLERAIAFLQNFNDDNFDILVQASTYYKFVILFLGAIGLLFQIPVGGAGGHPHRDPDARASCARAAATRSSASRCSPPWRPRRPIR